MPPEVKLPKQVREAGEKADKDLKALKENPGGKEGSEGKPQNTDPAAGEDPSKATPIEQGIPSGKQGKEQEGIDWQTEHGNMLQKYNVLKGKYDNEVPTLQRELRELKETLTKLQVQIGERHTELDNPEGTPAESGSEVPEDIKEMYGDNLINFITDRAKLAATNAVKTVTERLDVVTQDTERERRDVFYARLLEVHPDWEQINVTEKFLSFLKEIVPELGMERQSIINNAFATGNPEPIILQLTVFKKRSGNKGEQVRLAAQETPGGHGKPPADPAQGDDVDAINESDIAAFYTNSARGKYKGNPEEFKRLETMIQKAAQAGKIVMDISGGKQPLFAE